jgi:hypothetical protein
MKHHFEIDNLPEPLPGVNSGAHCMLGCIFALIMLLFALFLTP